MEPLPGPKNRKKRRNGKRNTVGAIPPLLSPVDLERVLNPTPEEEAAIPQPIEIPRESNPDPSRLSVVESEEFKGAVHEIIRRKSEALRIFVPLPEQERFFASHSPERIVLGGNRGGKTTQTVVEIARAVTGQDPHQKYPKEGGKCILVGKDLTHCSKVFYQKLFKPGAFKIIRDQVTGEWRTYNPNDPADAERSHEAKKSPPLIPARFYDYNKIAWENKKDEIPKTIPLKNGWTMHFFSSLGSPPQGWNVTMVCLAGWSMIYDPVAGRHRRIDEIDAPFHVESFNEKTGQIEVKPASKPFIKGFGEIVRVTFSDGAEIYTTRHHEVLACSGEYVSIDDAYRLLTPLLAPLGQSQTVADIATVGEFDIWDITVKDNHNYLYGGVVSHNCFDEEIEHPLWYPEMSARLLDDRTVDQSTGNVIGGKFIWSATPQSGTQQLYDLKCRADEIEALEIDDGSPAPTRAITVFSMGMLENKWVSDVAKQEFIAKFADNEDEVNVRVHGKFALLGTRVYSEFTPKGVHGCDSFPVPEDWTSYAVIDPGRQVCAVLFVAIPPPGSEWAGRKVVYDELYIKRCDAKTFAKRFVERVAGRPIEYGIIDHRAGRITEIGSGKTHEQQYSDALKAEGFKFERNKTAFMWSSDDVKAGIEAVRSAMHVVDGQSELVVFRDKCKFLLWEMERYSYRKLPNGVVTDEPIKLNDHAADCLRYLAVARLKYVKPRKRTRTAGYTTEYLKRKAERAKANGKAGGWGGAYKVG